MTAILPASAPPSTVFRAKYTWPVANDSCQIFMSFLGPSLFLSSCCRPKNMGEERFFKSCKLFKNRDYFNVLTSMLNDVSITTIPTLFFVAHTCCCPGSV